MNDPTNTSTGFSIERCKLVANRFFVLNRKNWTIGLLGALGFLVAFWLLMLWGGGASMSQVQFISLVPTAFFLYTLGGLIITSVIFKEMHEPTKAFQFLTLPASSLEKFTAAWLITFLAYTIIAIIALILLSIVMEVVYALQTGFWGNFEVFNPFESEHIERFVQYFFYHSVFFLGAAYFRKNHFIATALTIIVFFISVFILISILGFFIAYFYDGSFTYQFSSFEQHTLFYNVISIIIKTGIALLLLLFTYLNVKNKQVA